MPFNQDFNGNVINSGPTPDPGGTTVITTLPAYTAPVMVTDATNDSANDPAASCQTDTSRSVWYTFRPAVTGAYFISSCADAPTKTTVIDPIISIYTAPAGCGASTNFTEVPTQGAGTTGATDGCDDDSCFTEAQAVVQTQLTAGTTYYIVARQFQNVAPIATENTLHLRVNRATARIAQPGEVLISEFRLSGNGNQRDEYVELYNNTNVPLNIGDIFGVASFDPDLVGIGNPGDGVFVVGVSPGVVIPPRGYYLITNVFGTSSYSINSTPGNNRRTDFDGDYFLDNRGLAFVRLESDNNLRTIDAVGFSSDTQGNTAYAGATGQTSPNGFTEGTAITYNGTGTGGAIASQASFVRRLVRAVPVDTGNNANDFVLVSTAGPNAGVTSNLTSNLNGMAILGAPNPQNLQSPYRGFTNPIQAELANTARGVNEAPNAERFVNEIGPNAAQGTLAFRRRFVNTQQGREITTLRFRFTNLTTLGSPNQVRDDQTQADARALSSPGGSPPRVTITRADGSTVRLTSVTLDPPSVEGNGGLGGGLYSSVSVPFPALVQTVEGTITTADRIRFREAVVVEFLFGINSPAGSIVRFAAVIEVNQ
ncbi:MAG: lamin tail domain-containing protein [Pyrinomonadaceae bacterium MAG19_C2-C3]|nr:lamin tail domain-containing protein [Pyrinomonadaceae bacterium MAG19_C2-C3]